MKACEYCGNTDGEITGKTGKFGMDLCTKHWHQMNRYGEFTDRTSYTPNEIIVNGDIIEIVMYNAKGIESGKAIANTRHLGIVSQYKWCLDSNGYAFSLTGGCRTVLHRLITGAPKNMVVDHRNHNTIDCTDDNLRICTQRENTYNQRLRSDNTSGYKGVSWNKQSGKWRARIQVNGKDVTLGSFIDKQDAIDIRKTAETKYFGEFAYIQEVL